jgi:hypothetical protein
MRVFGLPSRSQMERATSVLPMPTGATTLACRVGEARKLPTAVLWISFNAGKFRTYSEGEDISTDPGRLGPLPFNPSTVSWVLGADGSVVDRALG